MPEKNGKPLIVIGAGLGGMSAALSLALEGYEVTGLREKRLCRWKTERAFR